MNCLHKSSFKLHNTISLSFFSTKIPTFDTTIGKNRKVILGLSGGVDSAVAAYILKSQGYHVMCIYMKNWDEISETGKCSGEKDEKDARKIAELFNLEFKRVDFVKEYWNNIFEEMLNSYKLGLTPNPDVLCNRIIKFKHFTNYANSIGAEFIATGHYARISNGRLFKGVDKKKDQSHFLCMVKSFSNILFPMGNYTKSETRSIAQSLSIPVWEKRSSRGLCFVGKRKHFTKFLEEFIPQSQSGYFQSHEGTKFASHRGDIYYTIGQNACISDQGHKYYVADKNIKTNVITVVPKDHPLLFHKGIKVDSISWIRKPDNIKDLKLLFKLRSEGNEYSGKLIDDNNILLDDYAKSISPGQVAGIYLQDECLGGGIIKDRYNCKYEI